MATRKPKILKSGEVANILGVSRQVVYDMGERKVLMVKRIPGTKTRLYDRDEVEALRETMEVGR